jgi:hypothetical protein
LTLILASTLLGTSVGATLGLNTHARDLLIGIFQDVGTILHSFEGGPDDPNSPVTNEATLRQDSDRLDSATRKAEQLATELSKLTNPGGERAH